MINDGSHTSVLIAGAGPSGLMMAVQLLRYGIQPVIIDSKQGPTEFSRALAVQARSLEIYRQAGIVDKALNKGKRARGLNFNSGGNNIASLSLANIGTDQTAFPFVLFYKQSSNEHLLLDYLTQNCCPVYWNTSLSSFNQGENKVDVELSSGNKSIKITCDWLIGADGAHSTVRKLLNIPFHGATYQSKFYIADVNLNNEELSPDEMTGFLAKNGFAGFFPFPESNHFRVMGNLPETNIKDDDLTLNALLPHIKQVTGLTLAVEKTSWFTIYRLHHRMADRFADQHCFLIGDAAHIHSPVGGQGMNTGLQDAYNLAWKLAGVINGQYRVNILESYAAERMPVAKDVLKTTDRIFSLIISDKWFVNIFKKHLLPKLLRFAWGKNSIKEAFFKRISQTGINYRHSKLNLHLSHSSKIKAGDRLPYMKLYDEKREEETDLHAWCAKPGFTLIIFGKFDELFLFNVARWITMKYNGLLNFYYLPPTGKNLDIFNAFEINPHLQKAIIVRPDMHIGFINDAVDLKLFDNYLKNLVGVL